MEISLFELHVFITFLQMRIKSCLSPVTSSDLQLQSEIGLHTFAQFGEKTYAMINALFCSRSSFIVALPLQEYATM